MPVESLTAFPRTLVAGNTLRVTFTGDYPSGEWTLAVVLTSSAVSQSFTADSVANNDYELVIPASETAKLTLGSYAVTLVYTQDDDRTSITYGSIQVLANPTATPTKSSARLALEALQEALPIVAAGTETTVNFNGQSMTLRTTKEVQDAILFQEGVVAREEAEIGLAAGTRRSRNIYTRFSRAGVYCE